MTVMDHSSKKETCDDCGRKQDVLITDIRFDRTRNKIVKICKRCYDNDRYGIKS